MKRLFWSNVSLLSLSTTASTATFKATQGQVVRVTSVARDSIFSPTKLSFQTVSSSIRGGGSGAADVSPISKAEFTVLSDPAPGSPFHYAFPVHDLAVAKDFYGTVLGCHEGRSSEKWQDYSLHGHQIVAHWVGNDYRCQDYYNPVDGDEVPVPHYGLALTVEQFQDLAERVRKAGVKFIIEPHLRFQGMPGEQYTVGIDMTNRVTDVSVS